MTPWCPTPPFPFPTYLPNRFYEKGTRLLASTVISTASAPGKCRVHVHALSFREHAF